jgi:ATP/maltotriose-dependent transcriptional regulator MalT
VDPLVAAAFHGHPGAADAVLAGLDPAGVVPERVRWLAGVCLGARGRYRRASLWLAPPAPAGPPAGVPAGSLAASCLASHWRQVGRHDLAEPLDLLALETATDAESRADALTGLVADAIGRRDVAAARERLAVASQWVNGSDTAWREAVRLAWVTAELGLLAGDAESAVDAGRRAEELSRRARARRHAVKSELVLGVALHAAGRSRPAARLLRKAAAGADRLDLIPLVIPARIVLSEILQVRGPETARSERQQARSAQSIIDVPATEGSSG